MWIESSYFLLSVSQYVILKSITSTLWLTSRFYFCNWFLHEVTLDFCNNLTAVEEQRVISGFIHNPSSSCIACHFPFVTYTLILYSPQYPNQSPSNSHRFQMPLGHLNTLCSLLGCLFSFPWLCIVIWKETR